MKIIQVTSAQKLLINRAVRKNKPVLLYGLFQMIVSSQFYDLKEFTDFEAMEYLNKNSKIYPEAIHKNINFYGRHTSGLKQRNFNTYLATS